MSKQSSRRLNGDTMCGCCQRENARRRRRVDVVCRPSSGAPPGSACADRDGMWMT